MQYYYLEGIEKRGPYTKDELKNRGLKPETLILSEGMENWLPINQVHELYEFLFSKESTNEVNNSNDSSRDHIKSEETQSITTEQSKIKISSTLFLLFCFGLCIGITYFITNSLRKNDLDEINKKIDLVFQGKNAVSDYSYDGTDGQLYDVYLSSFFEGIGDDKNVVRTKKRILAYKPADVEDDKYTSNNDGKKKQWDLFKSLVQYYETNPFNGFETIKAEKNTSYFTITNCWSGDMAYKVPETKHFSGYSSEYYSSPGYDLPTYRPSVGKCYEEAAKFLTVEEADKSYEAGSYNKIYSIPQTESKYYEVKQHYPIYTRLGDKIHVNYGKGIGEGDAIDNNKITDATSSSDAAVFNSQWIVWYKSVINTYGIEEKSGAFYKYWSIYYSNRFRNNFNSFLLYKK
jgi:hypothetical protein